MKTILNEVNEQEVVIKLKAWEIPYLLGSATLGIWAEDWCAHLFHTRSNSYDIRSEEWMCKVIRIIEQIKTQTMIEDEEKEFGNKQAMLEIEKIVDMKGNLNFLKYKKTKEEK